MPDIDPRLGRIPSPFDSRDAAYPMTLALVPPVVTTRYWVTGPVLDQDGVPECVAYAGEEFLNASPTRTKNGPTPHEIYQAAQVIDDGDPHEGTCVRSVLKVLQAEGRIANYLWADTVDDVINWLLSHGGVILGTNWYAGMMATDKHGFVNVTGSIVGGHGYFLNGHCAARKASRCLQSWGLGWGQRGRFWLRDADLARLLSENGEAVGMTERAVKG